MKTVIARYDVTDWEQDEIDHLVGEATMIGEPGDDRRIGVSAMTVEVVENDPVETLTATIAGHEVVATVSPARWPRSQVVGVNHAIVQHEGMSYVVAVTCDGFEAFAIDEVR